MLAIVHSQARGKDVPYRCLLRMKITVPKANTLEGIKKAAQNPTSFSMKVVATPARAPTFTHLKALARSGTRRTDSTPIVNVEDVFYCSFSIYYDFFAGFGVCDGVRFVGTLIGYPNLSAIGVDGRLASSSTDERPNRGFYSSHAKAYNKHSKN
jgi:hypothetical protein